MAVLTGLLALLGMVGAAVALVMLIVQFVFKRGWTKKRIWTVGAVSLALFVVGVVIGVSSAPDEYEAGYKAGQQEAQNKTEIDKTNTPSSKKEQSPSSLPSSGKLTEATEITEGEEQKAESAQEAENNNDLLKNIIVTVETQDAYDSKDRQKAVVWVINQTDRVFSGQLTIMVRSGEFSRGVEIFTVKDLKPGLRTWGIMWLRTSFMGEDTGSGAEPQISWSDIEFNPHYED
jgi:hypothetical protein